MILNPRKKDHFGNKCLKILLNAIATWLFSQLTSKHSILEVFFFKMGKFMRFVKLFSFFAGFDKCFTHWMDERAELREIIANGVKNFNWI